MAIVILWVLAALCLLALKAWFLTAPARARADHPAFRTKFFAHRGLHDAALGAPENSLAAFERAARAGYGIELDVRPTRDGKIVVFHDETLARMCGDSRRVDELTLTELQALRLNGTDERVPSFEETLSLVAGRVPLLVEIKSAKNVTRFSRGVGDALKGYSGAYLVQSFAPQAMGALRRHRPEVVRGQLVGGIPSGLTPPQALLAALHFGLCLNYLSRPHFVAFSQHIDNSRAIWLMRRVYRARLAVWTIRSPEELRAMKGRANHFIFEGFLPMPDDV